MANSEKRIANAVARAPALERGRQAFARQAWREAYDALSSSDHDALLEPADLVLMAQAALLVGQDAQCADALVRAHQSLVSAGDSEQAARCAFWLGFHLFNRREMAQAGGWFSRARRLLDEGQHDSAVRGYLLLPTARQALERGDGAAAYTAFGQAAEIGQRFNDADLVSLARHGQGRSLMRQGRTAAGVALLDEVMVGLVTHEMTPITVGAVYCSVIDACHEIFDLRRAQEWTAALARWFATQPDVVPFRGSCLVHRAELLQVHGGWSEAMDEARRAAEWLSDPPGQPAAGAAFYQQGELHRLRGQFADAEEAYRRASQCGRKPQPGLALLRLAQHRTDVATTTIRQALSEATDPRTRPLVLAAYVEIMIEADDLAAAGAAAEQLAAVATDLAVPFVLALSAHATGGTLLATGEPEAALPVLGDAWTLWRDLDAPYEAARTRVLIALAHWALRDEETAALELDAARSVFERLGAAPNLDRLAALPRPAAPNRAGGLTSRERQVLGVIATGRTNRAIATRLGISEKTVARHVSNIFTKLRVSTRAAATAYAYEHDLLERTTRTT